MMYDLRPFNADGPSIMPGRHDRAVEAIALGAGKYQALCFRSHVRSLVGKLTGKPHRLLDLGEVKAAGRLVASHDAGVQAVALRAIVGSEDRAADFDDAFCPTSECTGQRWAAIYAARFLGTPLPAVKLIRVGERYFVRDGHHRVSVARQLREEYADAEVTVWEMVFEAETEWVGVKRSGLEIVAA